MASHIPQIEKVCPVCSVTYLARPKDLGYGCTRKCSTRTVALIQFEKAVEGRDTEVIRLYNAGFGYQAIRTRTGMHLGLVRKICQLAGIVDETRMHAMKARLKTPNWKKTKPAKNDPPIRRAECATPAERLIMLSYHEERKRLRKYDERYHWQWHPCREGYRAMLRFQRYKEKKTNWYLSVLLRSKVGTWLRHRKTPGKMHRHFDLVGCSLYVFQNYIQARFKRGMHWNNYGSVWDIDHIIPCKAFDLSKPEDQRKCFHYSNMQPLFKDDNNRKRGRVLPTQQELLLAL